MRLWRIEPRARADDPRWQDRPIWREVVVRAESAATARVVARQLEAGEAHPPVGNESLTFRSGFDDTALYWVRALDSDEAAALADEEGPIVRAVPYEAAARP